jgi:hypothetical protein
MLMEFSDFLWYAGFLCIAISGHFLFRGSPEEKMKKQWLEFHFGKIGMQNWLVSSRLSDEFYEFDNAKLWWYTSNRNPKSHFFRNYKRALAKVEKSKKEYGDDCFELIRRLPDGSLTGLVLDGSWRYPKYDGFPSISRPPWEPTISETVSEYKPTGADWLAAGYRTKVMQNNGVVFDPISMFLREGGQIK